MLLIMLQQESIWHLPKALTMASIVRILTGGLSCWVQILAKSSIEELWRGEINGKEYSHSRVYKISGDRFYALLTGCDDALYQLYRALPLAIKDYMQSLECTTNAVTESALDEILSDSRISGRSVIDQITFDNYNYYNSFSDL